MKLIILIACVGLAVAAVDLPEPVKIIRSDFQQNQDGGYSFGYETADGTVRDETAVAKEVLDEEKKPHTVLTVRGSYSYKNPDGVVETVNYSADEDGFKAEGDSIPKNPPARR